MLKVTLLGLSSKSNADAMAVSELYRPTLSWMDGH